MKRLLMCFLSFFILFSSVDLSIINLFRTFNFETKSSSISDIVKVQYDLLQKTKIVVSTVCNTIVKDVSTILTSIKVTKTYIDLYNFSINKEYLKYCVLLVVPLIQKISSINLCNKETKIPLFFFGFIFLFILKYLGLLFTFGKITISQQYSKAYSM